MTSEQILARLSEECADTIITADILKTQIEENRIPPNVRFVPYDVIRDFANKVRETEKVEEIERTSKLPVKQFLFVESGSIDIDSLIDELKTKNPEIKVVEYRQGSEKPSLVDRKKKEMR